MPDEEHLSAIRHVVEHVDGRLPVIAGTGSKQITVHAIELTEKAQEIGADAILSVSPYYNKTSQKGLYYHFKAIAESTDLPVILYNIPSRTGINIDPDTVCRLSGVENIVAVKECNLSQVPQMVNLCGENITIYSGEDAQVLPILSFGGKGVISVMANIIPEQTHDLVDSFLRGDLEKSRDLQVKYVPLIKALFSDVNPMPIKAAMNHLGFGVGKCRMPLCEMDPQPHQALCDVLDSYGLERREL